jgi:hypothetical protein
MLFGCQSFKVKNRIRIIWITVSISGSKHLFFFDLKQPSAQFLHLKGSHISFKSPASLMKQIKIYKLGLTSKASFQNPVDQLKNQLSGLNICPLTVKIGNDRTWLINKTL